MPNKRSKYSFITQHKKTWPIDPMCRLLGVKRCNYYSFTRRHQNKTIVSDHEKMLRLVKYIAKFSDHTYGWYT